MKTAFEKLEDNLSYRRTFITSHYPTDAGRGVGMERRLAGALLRPVYFPYERWNDR